MIKINTEKLQNIRTKSRLPQIPRRCVIFTKDSVLVRATLLYPAFVEASPPPDAVFQKFRIGVVLLLGRSESFHAEFDSLSAMNESFYACDEKLISNFFVNKDNLERSRRTKPPRTKLQIYLPIFGF